MASVVCPSITAVDAKEYREQMARVALFAQRVHLDFSDGLLAPLKLINPIQSYWPDEILADMHLMYQNPRSELETVIGLRPQLVIVHAEAQGDVIGMMRELQAVGIKAGVALLQPTQPESAESLIATADHVLIFSGTLGHFGGHADMALLKKIRQIRAINSAAEIGWDGGVNLDNIRQLALEGVNVLVSGGSIHNAPDPAASFKELQAAVASI